MVKTIISTINNPDTVTVRVIDLDGKSVIKNISFDDYIKMLKGNSVTNVVRTRLHIPTETYDVVYGGSDDFAVVFIIKPQIAPVSYMQSNYTIPFPQMCFFVNVKNNNVVSTRVFALKSNRICDTTPLYHYPFGNVHSNGDICWGSNKLPHIFSLRDALSLFSIFMSAETNSDLWSEKWCRIKGIAPVLSGVYGYLNNKTKFPESALKRVEHDIRTQCIRDLLN